MSDSSSSSCSETSNTVKKRKYDQVYKSTWAAEEKFSGWLEESKKVGYFVFLVIFFRQIVYVQGNLFSKDFLHLS